MTFVVRDAVRPERQHSVGRHLLHDGSDHVSTFVWQRGVPVDVREVKEDVLPNAQ
jgi:hypothetical protein